MFIYLFIYYQKQKMCMGKGVKAGKRVFYSPHRIQVDIDFFLDGG